MLPLQEKLSLLKAKESLELVGCEETLTLIANCLTPGKGSEKCSFVTLSLGQIIVRGHGWKGRMKYI